MRWSRREAARDTDRADLSVPLLAIGVLLIGHVLILFFDLVLVFTHTQLTSLLAHDRSVESMARVVLVFIVLFWMYGAFA